MNDYIHSIWLILGDACNLNCKYCQQHQIDKQIEANKINPKTIEYIHKVCNNNGKRTEIVFYGGEPLIYYDIVQDIVNQTKDIKNITYTMVTNGKLLNQEMVDFFNQYNFNLNISWDGPNSLNTRGYNVLKEKEDLLLKLNRMVFEGVITNQCYPLEFCSELDMFFHKWRKQHLNRKVGDCHPYLQFIKDNNQHSQHLTNFDYDRIGKEVELILKYYIDYLNNVVPYSTKCVLAKSWSRNTPGLLQKYDIVPCNPGYTNINMNINGNIYYCHNNRTIVGDLDTSVEELRNNIHKVDKTPENYNALCKDCDVLDYCRCGCCEVDLQGRKDYYCKCKQAAYRIIKKYRDKIQSMTQNTLNR